MRKPLSKPRLECDLLRGKKTMVSSSSGYLRGHDSKPGTVLNILLVLCFCCSCFEIGSLLELKLLPASASQGLGEKA